MRNKIRINQTLFDTLLKHKRKKNRNILHYIIYFYVCVQEIFRFVENPLPHGNSICYGLLRI